MAHTIQTYRGAQAAFTDGELIGALGILLNTGPEQGDAARIFRIWADESRNAGPGIMDLRLDEVLSSEWLRSSVAKTVQEVAETLPKGRILAQLLHSAATPSDVVFVDVESDVIRAVLNRLEALLIGGP